MHDMPKFENRQIKYPPNSMDLQYVDLQFEHVKNMLYNFSEHQTLDANVSKQSKEVKHLNMLKRDELG